MDDHTAHMERSVAHRRKKKWIAGAIKHPGALTATARRAGKLTPSGTIDTAWLAAQANKGGVVGRRARFAQTLRKMNR